jgi:hypothetical protein
VRTEAVSNLGSALLLESESTLNAPEGSDDHPNAVLPLLPRACYSPAWHVVCKQVTFSVRACLEGRGRTLLLA